MLRIVEQNSQLPTKTLAKTLAKWCLPIAASSELAYISEFENKIQMNAIYLFAI